MEEFKSSLQHRDNPKSIGMFKVLTELTQKEEAVKTYIDYVCTQLIFVQPGVSDGATNDLEKFGQEHAAFNVKIYQVFENEIATNGENKGRILEVFGGELWYRITFELINR